MRIIIADANILGQLINGGAACHDLNQLSVYQRLLADMDGDLRYTITDLNMFVNRVNGIE